MDDQKKDAWSFIKSSQNEIPWPDTIFPSPHSSVSASLWPRLPQLPLKTEDPLAHDEDDTDAIDNEGSGGSKDGQCLY